MRHVTLIGEVRNADPNQGECDLGAYCITCTREVINAYKIVVECNEMKR
jgi:hypothetical protein